MCQPRNKVWDGDDGRWVSHWAVHAEGLPRSLSSKEPTWQCRRHRTLGFNPWVRRIPWSRKWQPTPVFFPEKFHGQRSLAGYSSWGHKKLDTAKQLSTHMPVGKQCSDGGKQTELSYSVTSVLWRMYSEGGKRSPLEYKLWEGESFR